MTLYSAPLDLEQFANSGNLQLPIEFSVWTYWQTFGYPIEEIQAAYTVIHERDGEEDTGHIVLKITTLEKPIDTADAGADQFEMHCCDCARFQYHEGVDLEETPITEWGECHHIEFVTEDLE